MSASLVYLRLHQILPRKFFFQLKEITTYWLNLKEANSQGGADWKVLYDFTAFYNLKDLTAKSLDGLAQSLKPGVDES